ncbi:hypothetical protein [Ottowia testudinis]|uniref:DUF2846 domain-containing protein n=1 Tax=Ottowia testudinis TaxID=2816950 RepID=A0A975CHX6_9BURK|nr:hypothetical protein [Ottowia testudinis]QTD45401.1 hypothetical protein J1M35_00255 [Ottowia testudinis]
MTATATAALLVIGLAGCAASGSLERWQVTEPVTPTAVPRPDQPASAVRVVFFREAGSSAKAAQPINLYINGHYQASLVGSTYTEQSLCPGAHRVAVHLNDVRTRYVTKTEGAPLQVGADSIQYFRVVEDAAGNVAVQPVAASAAQGVSSLRLLQTHTLPRVVNRGCAGQG